MEKTNYCKIVDCLSRCTLIDTKEQYKCKFFIKASKSALNSNQCRAYRPDYNNHCDNTNAQMDAIKPATKDNDKIEPIDFSY